MKREYHKITVEEKIQNLLNDIVKNANKEEQIEHVLVIEDADFEKLKNTLDEITEFESSWIESDDASSVIFSTSLKNISSNNKIKCILHAMENDNTVDQWMLLNLYNIIKGYNTFADEYFDAEEVYFNSLVELMDALAEIKEDDRYNAFLKNICVYYLSILKTVGITSGKKLESAEVLPLLYQRILFMSDFIAMSNIMNKSAAINTDELKVINGAYVYLLQLSQKFLISDQFMQ